MKCPKCASNDLKVNEKRDLEAEMAIRRRRECNFCGYRFTTYERIEVPSLLIVKKSGDKELYSRDKLAGGIKRAFEKRPFNDDVIEEIIDDLDQAINSCGEKELNSKYIGNLVLQKIKEIDPVAYLRFASVYKSFDNLEKFEQELNKVKSETKEGGV